MTQVLVMTLPCRIICEPFLHLLVVCYEHYYARPLPSLSGCSSYPVQQPGYCYPGFPPLPGFFFSPLLMCWFPSKLEYGFKII